MSTPVVSIESSLLIVPKKVVVGQIRDRRFVAASRPAEGSLLPGLGENRFISRVSRDLTTPTSCGIIGYDPGGSDSYVQHNIHPDDPNAGFGKFRERRESYRVSGAVVLPA